MTQDIRPFGAGGLAYVWVKVGGGHLAGREVIGSLHLIAISDTGEVSDTKRRRPWDAVALTEDEAVSEHLAGAIGAADAALERRREQVAKEPDEEPPPPPMDPATRRFLEDGW